MRYCHQYLIFLMLTITYRFHIVLASRQYGKPTIRSQRACRATGVGSVSCTQNQMYWPNSMGDLQKSERYIITFLRAFLSLMVAPQIFKYGLFILCKRNQNCYPIHHPFVQHCVPMGNKCFCLDGCPNNA
jgi:hypothetical protein